MVDRCDRAIVHIDLDCFYAQVEMLRLGIPFHVPFVVVQWYGLIAVNYAARDCGVKRFGTDLAESRKLCPDLQWAHVATYAPGEDGWAYHPQHLVKRATHKVSLEPYREASRRIFDVLKSFNGCSVEKGGVDEAFLDVTEAALAVIERFELADSRTSGAVDDIIATQQQDAKHPETNANISDTEEVLPAPAAVAPDAVSSRTRDVTPEVVEALRAAAAECTAFLDEHHERMQNSESLAAAPIVEDSGSTRALYYAACLVVDRIRAALKARLGYEASAGIGKNRTLAKIISAKHKPNRQTLLLPGASKTFLHQQPFEKMRGFGGKLGRAIATHFMATTCGDLWAVSPEAFKPFTDGDLESAIRITRLVRGEAGDTELTERSAPKSLLAQKAFQPATSDPDAMLKWIRVLTHELEQRIAIVFDEHHVRPYNFNVKVGGNGLGAMDILNKSVEMPWPPDGEVMAQTALSLVKAALAKAPAGTKVNCFLIGGTVLKPDPTADLRDGKFHVSKRQSRIEDWLQQAPRRQPKAEAAVQTVKQERCPADSGHDSDVVIEDSPTQSSTGSIEVVEAPKTTSEAPRPMANAAPPPHQFFFGNKAPGKSAPHSSHTRTHTRTAIQHATTSASAAPHVTVIDDDD